MSSRITTLSLVFVASFLFLAAKVQNVHQYELVHVSSNIGIGAIVNAEYQLMGVVSFMTCRDTQVSEAGSSEIADPEGAPGATTVYQLDQNFPNPFNPLTTIRFSIPVACHVSLDVFDAKGRLVSRLVDSDLESGTYGVPFDAESLSSGVYFYRLSAGEFRDTKKLVVLK